MKTTYLFYTDEGYTISPNDKDVENFQILGFEEGVDKEDALRNLHKSNTWIRESGFKDENIICRIVSSYRV
ncbi:MAG: hypothetical protein PHY15_01925 [Eubacteriales bacterium]|nr:hypothetical protein [Eubacteriales bacterium]MDD4474836.1 hypothetical protein [Eubacteriales bacterium]